ncbi:QuateRNAry ammonium compound-resistance protein [Roseomonas mucosa]|uniref:Methyl viologen resistance protein C n=1 Tax=Roseomonas mucosa TaxID=207340 RepID=A0A1S8D6R9_9PROT|nr:MULTISPECIES: SMR family transporter [Roseomonas]MBS5901459.1 QacE family quaternary ammonium compound efflux SMR transporter [Acetobacteraceae bacterium]MCG7353353.1 SMR family transporter [Roseomonas mucosa]MCG7357771.1 SMR family transporter [Roseomonas mucosa]MDT8288946.1 SMR family transporter [Roseomonas mucosa]MDT8294513.1 SMR family transporter [Roseomonas mucosa]
MRPYLFLLVAICGEVAGTLSLKASDGFTRLWPSVFTMLCYVLTFYMLSLAIRTIPVGVAYAIWSGLGIVMISVLSLVLFRQHLDLPAILGMALILAGVLVINLLSRSASH